MGIWETIMIYAIAFLLVAPHLGMVLAVIWTIMSPPLEKSKKKTKCTTNHKRTDSATGFDQNRSRLGQNNQQHLYHTHDQAICMAQNIRDTAVRDSWAMHENANNMAQNAHDIAVNDHNYSVDLNDHMVNDPGFGCGPFF